MKRYIRAARIPQKITYDDVYNALKQYEGKYMDRNHRTYYCRLYSTPNAHNNMRVRLSGELIPMSEDTFELLISDRRGYGYGSIYVYAVNVPQEYLEEYLDKLSIMQILCGGIGYTPSSNDKQFSANTIDEMLKCVDMEFKLSFKWLKKV